MNAPLRLRLRSSLMMGCAACGLAASLPGAARAQAFQANPATQFGNVTYNRGTPGIETVTVNSDSAVIVWQTNTSAPSNPYIFLPAGNVATFQNGVNNSNFVVLNRIVANGAVQFDGRVVSQLVGATGTAAPGGTIIFSTPGGIILGASAVFDVGNLVLTTLNVNVDAAGNFYDAATRGFTFSSSALAAPPGAITTLAGARFNAPNPNSYVAFVAPTITHGGNIQVNGAAAFIAGNQVEMRANDGLFDIVVQVGTDSAIPITHTGTTGGPASTGAADVHRIYMVAVPRTQAITTLLQGNIGFNNAVSASVENGAIVLSAGYNVAGGSVDASAPVNPDLAANISIQGGTINSRLTGYAVTDAIASGVSTGQLHAVQDLTLVGGRTAAVLAASAGETVALDRNATLIAPGGTAGIATSQSGRVTVGGNALIDATGTGFSPPANVSADAGNGTGGEASLYSDGGSIVISGSATLLARGIGGHASYQADKVGAGGIGTGGIARVVGTNGGTVAISGNLAADASGVGGFTTGYSANIAPVPGANGQGGQVYVVGSASGSVSVTGSSALSSNGQGGASIYTAGGAGSGDRISIQAAGGAVTLTGPVTISATGTGGQGASGGTGTGGALDLNASSGAVRILGATSADLRGQGGAALRTAAAGNGIGGTISILDESDTGAVDILSFDGRADGTGAAGSSGTNGGAGGAGRGGFVTIVTSTDQIVSGVRPGIRFGSLAVSANGTGGAGGTAAANGIGGAAGAGNGGTITLSATQAPITITGQSTFGATGMGGAAPAAGGTGATGTGGRINMIADRTTLALGTNAVAGANGIGGTGPTGGGGTGGSVQMRALGGPTASAVTGGSVVASATGKGGAGANAAGGTPAGRGGNGGGGSVTLLADAVRGTIAFGATTADARGTGGDGGAGASPATSGRGGDGTGGSTTVGTDQNATPSCSTAATCAAAATGSATFAGLDMSSSGVGGQGGIRGDSVGGRATLQSVGAPTVVTGAATMRADADSEGTSGGTFGLATGGVLTLSASVNSATGTAGRIQANGIDGSANAIRAAAASTAGRWQISASGPSAITAVNIDLSASGTAPATATPPSTINLAGGTLNVSGTANLNAGGDIRVLVDGAGGLRGTGSVGLNSAGNVTVSHTNRGTGFTIDTGGFGARGQNVTLNAGTLSRAGTSVDLRADRLINVSGAIAAPNMFLASADLDITGTGFIGDPATQRISIEALPPPGQTFAAQIVFGGTTQGPGYTLTNAEFGRIRTNRLNYLTAPVGNAANRIPDLIIRDLALTAPGSTSPAGVNFLDIIVANDRFGVDGITQIEGALSLANASATSGISLNSTARIQVVTPAGSVRIRDAAGAPAGTLTLIGNNIWVTNQAILTRLLADAGYATRDADLADNGGTVAPRGYVEAGAISIATRDSLFVQNSGDNATNQFSLTGPAFGGITVGPGGLAIGASSTSASVTAFGRRINADGTATIGYDFFFTVDFRGGAANGAAGSPTGYSAASTFNSCIIATGQCPLRRPEDTGPGGRDPIVGPSGTIQLPPGIDDDNVDTSFATEPLIEEPVTSGGESTSWTPPCDPARDQRCAGDHP